MVINFDFLGFLFIFWNQHSSFWFPNISSVSCEVGSPRALCLRCLVDTTVLHGGVQKWHPRVQPAARAAQDAFTKRKPECQNRAGTQSSSTHRQSVPLLLFTQSSQQSFLSLELSSSCNREGHWRSEWRVQGSTPKSRLLHPVLVAPNWVTSPRSCLLHI